MEIKLIWPVAGRGRPRKRHIPDVLSRAAEDVLDNAEWQNVSWRNGTKGRLEARFAAVRVRTADGPPQRIKDLGQQHLPGTKPGSSANTGRRERRNIISPTCRPRHIYARWLPRSKRDGFANRPISS